MRGGGESPTPKSHDPSPNLQLEEAKMSNFLVISLCDNDFGAGMDLAAAQVLSYGLDQQPEKVSTTKQLIKAALLHQRMEENTRVGLPLLEGLDRVETYLDRALKVSFERHRPDIDHDGGSRYIDLHTRQVCRY